MTYFRKNLLRVFKSIRKKFELKMLSVLIFNERGYPAMKIRTLNAFSSNFQQVH